MPTKLAVVNTYVAQVVKDKYAALMAAQGLSISAGVARHMRNTVTTAERKSRKKRAKPTARVSAAEVLA